MSRPCRCDRDGCRQCWLARHDARYMRLWGIEGEPEPVPAGSVFKPARLPPLPCAHLGDELTAARCQAIGVDPRKRWYRCERGVQLQEYPAGVVCSCAGCGPRCSEYEAECSGD